MPVALAEPVTRNTPGQSPVPSVEPSTLRNPLKELLGCAKPLIAPTSSDSAVRQAPSTQSTPICVRIAVIGRLANADDSMLPVQVPATFAMVGSAAGGDVGGDGPLPPQLTSAQIARDAARRRETDDIYRPTVSDIQTDVVSQRIERLPPGPERFGAISNVNCSTGGLMGLLRSATRPRSASGWYCVWKPLGSLLTISVHWLAVGSIQMMCGPAGTFSVSSWTGLSLSRIVASSAPGHQTRSKGTSAPKIVRPRIDGRP